MSFWSDWFPPNGPWQKSSIINRASLIAVILIFNLDTQLCSFYLPGAIRAYTNFLWTVLQISQKLHKIKKKSFCSRCRSSMGRTYLILGFWGQLNSFRVKIYFIWQSFKVVFLNMGFWRWSGPFITLWLVVKQVYGVQRGKCYRWQ